ncbi:MAG: beta-propeller domain-containing protein, partial [Leptospiraceae bacterium]|nr:beta-propeller domain-containing protein [Leptospiraceae bacterium]
MDYVFTVFKIIIKEYNFHLNDKILIIILLSLMGCDYHNKNNECIVSEASQLSVSYSNNLEFSKKLEKFNGCEELNTTAIQIVNDHKNNWYYDMIDPPYCSGAAISNSENLNSDDNKNNLSFQESNVSELDLYQIKDNILIISKGNGIELVNKNTLSPIQSLTFENIKNIKLFLNNDRLIAIGNINENNTQGNLYQDNYNFKSYTIIKVFKVHPTHLQELYHNKILGELKVARLLKTGQLTIITHKNLLSLQSSNINSNDETSFSFPWSHNSDEFDQVNCNNYFKPIISNNETSITNISTFDINNLNWQNKKAIFGSFDPIYITEKNINLFKYSYTKPLLPENSSSNTAMVSLNLTDLEPVSPILTIKGNLNDRWSVKSLNNGKNIAIATSVRKKVSNPDDPNILFSMRDNEFTIYQTPKDTESDWTINSKISNFAINEDIRSVRFLDNKAFIVTFRKTDPLFMIDLSNPNDAKIISQLKIPGFSTYLQPFKNNQLIGVG